jgi:hypothetical protein
MVAPNKRRPATWVGTRTVFSPRFHPGGNSIVHSCVRLSEGPAADWPVASPAIGLTGLPPFHGVPPQL